jgi:hypothetical protein
MSRKQQTVATFAVTIPIPKGCNIDTVLVSMRTELYSARAAIFPNTAPADISPHDFTVSLIKRITTYGN